MDPSIEGESIFEEDNNEKIRIMLIGDANVGKTSIIKKYCLDEFSQAYVTSIGLDFQIKFLDINQTKIKLQIWDTTSHERYQFLSKNYFNTSEGFIIVYDITNRKSFENVSFWVNQITEMAPNYTKCILFGNKCDLNKERKIELSEGKDLGKKYNYKFFETSSKDGKNIDKGFEYIVKEILGNFGPVKSIRRGSYSLKRKTHQAKVKQQCC